MVRANDVGWSSPEIVSTLVAGSCLLVGVRRRGSAGCATPMMPMRLFRSRAFAVGNVTMFFMSGATFAAAFLVIQEFQFARGYSPVSTGLRLLPFFGTPMIVSPLAGALSDRIGRRPIMVTGLTLQALGFAWVAARGSLHDQLGRTRPRTARRRCRHLDGAPTVPTAVLSSVAASEMGKASGISYMAQRFGAVFAIAIASAVFSAHGNLSSPAAVTAGFQARSVVLRSLRRTRRFGVTRYRFRTSRCRPPPTHPTSSSMPNPTRKQ